MNPMTNACDDVRDALALQLLQTGAVTFEGAARPVINLQAINQLDSSRVTEGIRQLAASCIRCLLYQEKLSFDSCIALPQSAERLADEYSASMRIKRFVLNDGKLITGLAKPASVLKSLGEVLLIGDYVATGAKVLQTLDALKAEGLTVTHAVVLINSGEGVAERLDAKGYKLHWVFSGEDLRKIHNNPGGAPEETPEESDQFPLPLAPS